MALGEKQHIEMLSVNLIGKAEDQITVRGNK